MDNLTLIVLAIGITAISIDILLANAERWMVEDDHPIDADNGSV